MAYWKISFEAHNNHRNRGTATPTIRGTTTPTNRSTAGQHNHYNRGIATPTNRGTTTPRTTDRYHHKQGHHNPHNN